MTNIPEPEELERLAKLFEAHSKSPSRVMRVEYEDADKIASVLRFLLKFLKMSGTIGWHWRLLCALDSGNLARIARVLGEKS